MNVAIIAAAGQGKRMAGMRPKQFLELAGTPIIIHTLKAFERCDSIQEMVVVAAAEEVDGLRQLARKYDLQKIMAVVQGGATRAESVRNGLYALNEADSDIVAVHDGVRPFVTADEISRTLEAAKLEGAAILVSTPVDTVKEVRDGVVVKTLNRAGLRNALTPQCFDYKLLRRAYEGTDASDPALTDESSLVERLGVRIAIVEGSSSNIKITQPEDLVVAEAILKNWS
jgi:2-C-methyl-D-erythritol 4-phosphate cytidylyltransferase